MRTLDRGSGRLMSQPGIAGLVALLAAVALNALAPTSIEAATGVSINLGRVTVAEPLKGGQRLDLPRFTVSNPGDETATYVMSVAGLADDAASEPEASWFTFTPAEFTLEPGQVQAVRARLDLPADAATGPYVGLVRAQLTAAGEGSLVGAAAAARLQFVVADNTSAGADVGNGSLDSLSPWVQIAGLAVLGVLGATLLGRRYRISIRRR